MKLLRILVVLSTLTAFAPAALLTDPVDSVTYGIWTYKWKDLSDTLYLHKIKDPYMYYKLSGLTTATPFITTFDGGFGVPIPGFGTLALVGSVYERTASYVSLQSNYLNKVNGSTNATDTDVTPSRQYFNNGLDAALGFSTKLGDAYLMLQYVFSGAQNRDSQSTNTMTAKQESNGFLLANYTRTTAGYYLNQSTMRHTISVGLEAAPFEAQLTATLSDVNNAFNYSNDTKVSTLSSNGSSEFESGLSTLKYRGLNNYTTGAALIENPTTVLRHQFLDLSLSPRMWNILGAKWYLEGNFKTAFFDKANNKYSFQTITEMKDTSGNTTNKSDSLSETAYTATYTEVGGNLRMKKVWKGERASFGLYPRVIAQYQSASMDRTLSSNQTVLSNTTSTTVTNFSADSDSKKLSALNWDIRLPVGIEWKVDKFFTIYNSARARLQINDKTVTTVEKNGDAVAAAVTHETTSVTRTIAPTLTGEYAMGFLWAPSEQIEFLLSFNAGKTFLAETVPGTFFAGADLSWVFKF